MEQNTKKYDFDKSNKNKKSCIKIKKDYFNFKSIENTNNINYKKNLDIQSKILEKKEEYKSDNIKNLTKNEEDDDRTVTEEEDDSENLTKSIFYDKKKDKEQKKNYLKEEIYDKDACYKWTKTDKNKFLL